MTAETWDNLQSCVGRHMTSHEWKELIKEEFGVSGNVAKKMYHAMLENKEGVLYQREVRKQCW